MRRDDRPPHQPGVPAQLAPPLLPRLPCSATKPPLPRPPSGPAADDRPRPAGAGPLHLPVVLRRHRHLARLRRPEARPCDAGSLTRQSARRPAAPASHRPGSRPKQPQPPPAGLRARRRRRVMKRGHHPSGPAPGLGGGRQTRAQIPGEALTQPSSARTDLRPDRHRLASQQPPGRCPRDSRRHPHPSRLASPPRVTVTSHSQGWWGETLSSIDTTHDRCNIRQLHHTHTCST